MKKVISILVALMVGIVFFAPADEAQAQVISNRCCDAAGNVRCLMNTYGPVGLGCFCYGQGSGWVC